MMMIFVTDIYEELDWLPSFINVSYNCFNDLKHIIYEQLEKQTTEKNKRQYNSANYAETGMRIIYKTHCILFISIGDRAHATIV